MWLLENLKHQAWSLFKAFAFTVVSARNVLPRGIHISTSVSSSDHLRKSFSLRPSLITLFETCDLCPIPFPIPSLGLGQLHSFFRSFFFFFWPCCMACGILVPGLLAVEAQSPDHWAARAVPPFICLIVFSFQDMSPVRAGIFMSHSKRPAQPKNK